MAFEVENFKEVGDTGNSIGGGQLYSIFSETDTLAEMLLDGYLNLLSDILNKRDFIFLSAPDGSIMVQVDSNISGVIKVVDFIGGNDAVTDNGATLANLIPQFTEANVNSVTISMIYEMPNGTVIGQKKFVSFKSTSGASCKVRPGLFADGTEIELTPVTEFAEFFWVGPPLGWKLRISNGVTT